MIFSGSKKDLLHLIKQKGSLSIDDAVNETGLTKTTLREHFIMLERDGYISREYVRSGPGRPSLHYQMTAEGNQLFPSSESDMIRELLKFLKAQGEEKTIEAFFEEFWEQRLQKARRYMDEASEQHLHSRLDELMKVLEKEGFMPEYDIDDESQTLTIKECNCPFSEVVKETRLPCKLEAMFYQKIFDRAPNRTTHIADGDFACTYRFSMKS